MLGGWRSACAYASLDDPNIIIVVGGYNRNDKHLRCCEVICLDQTQQGQTRTLPTMTTPRALHTLVLVENRFIVAMGGYDGSRRWSSVEYLDLEEEAQEQQQWRPLPSMKTARSLFAAFYCPENHKIVVAGGSDGDKRLDTVEELPILFRGSLREPPRPRDLPSGRMDAAHRTRIQQWLDEMDEQMTGFLKDIKRRERELKQERRENRQRCNNYKALINEKLCQATGISSWMADSRSARGDPTNLPDPTAVPSDIADIAPHQDPRQPPALTKIPGGFMEEWNPEPGLGAFDRHSLLSHNLFTKQNCHTMATADVGQRKYFRK